MTQTATSGRRRASVDQVHQQHAVASRPAHPTRRSLRQASSTPAAVGVTPSVQVTATPAIAPTAPAAVPATRAVAPIIPAAAGQPSPEPARRVDTRVTVQRAAQPELPTRRQLRERATRPGIDARMAADASAPEAATPFLTLQTPPGPPTPTRASVRHGAAPRTSPLGRLRDNATAAGLVMASAGLVLAAVAPSDTETDRTATAAHELTFASSVTAADAVGRGAAAAVTAPASADVTFGLESAGPAADGLPPSIVSARSLSSSVSPTAREREAFGLPVAGAEVASTFGYRVNPMGGSGSELHTGLDYASPCGTDVVAADDGTVVESGWHAFGGGQRIVVDHGDGMKTTYNHMSVLGVPAGAAVSRGDSLGSVGSTGNSTGCHLHFEVMVNDEKVDPAPWL